MIALENWHSSEGLQYLDLTHKMRSSSASIYACNPLIYFIATPINSVNVNE